MNITSTSNPYIKEVVLLKKSSYRKQKKQFLIQGEDFISEALKYSLVEKVFTLSDKKYDVETIKVSENVLKKLSVFENSMQDIAICSYPNLKKELGNKLVYLDGVQDPGNVGTIIRTAKAFNYDGVVLSSDSASLFSQKVIHATKGTIFSLPVYEDLDLKELKDKGYEIIVSALKNSIDYKTISNPKKFVLVLGNEGQGVKEKTLQIASKVVKIEISNVDSLNVSVAGGILMERYR